MAYDAVSKSWTALKTEKSVLSETSFNIQGVTGGKDQTSGGCSYVKLYRYNPKHLYPKLNDLGDNGQCSLKL